MKDEHYMKIALKLAKKAFSLNEIPVGCVIVKDGKIIGKGYNKKEREKSSTSHAEIIAIKKANKKLDNWRLDGCKIYITLEPCLMCAGAIKEARIDKIIFGAYDKKNGYSVYAKDLFSGKQIVSGLMEKESKKLLKIFFINLRRGAGVDDRGGLENR